MPRHSRILKSGSDINRCRYLTSFMLCSRQARSTIPSSQRRILGAPSRIRPVPPAGGSCATKGIRERLLVYTMESSPAPVAEPSDMGTAELPGRHVLDISIVRSLSQRSDLRGALRFALHLALLATTGTLVWLAYDHWYTLLPAMVLHGFGIVTMFAPMHECVHRTAFKTRQLNDAVGWIAGLFCFYNSTYYRR